MGVDVFFLKRDPKRTPRVVICCGWGEVPDFESPEAYQ